MFFLGMGSNFIGVLHIHNRLNFHYRITTIWNSLLQTRCLLDQNVRGCWKGEKIERQSALMLREFQTVCCFVIFPFHKQVSSEIAVLFYWIQVFDSCSAFFQKVLHHCAVQGCPQPVKIMVLLPENKAAVPIRAVKSLISFINRRTAYRTFPNNSTGMFSLNGFTASGKKLFIIIADLSAFLQHLRNQLRDPSHRL